MATYAGIKSVQRGTVNRTSDVETTFVQTITSVDLTKAFVSYVTARDTATNAAVGNFYTASKLTSATNLSIYFTGNATDRTFEYEIVEFY